MIDAMVILHNILIKWGEEEDTLWIDFDDFSDLDDAMRAPYQEGDELNKAILYQLGWQRIRDVNES
jgi:hypothetical protein